MFLTQLLSSCCDGGSFSLQKLVDLTLGIWAEGRLPNPASGERDDLENALSSRERYYNSTIRFRFNSSLIYASEAFVLPFWSSVQLSCWRCGLKSRVHCNSTGRTSPLASNNSHNNPKSISRNPKGVESDRR